MEFTLKAPTQTMPTRSHASEVQEEMLKILRDDKDVNNKILTLIEVIETSTIET